MNKTILVLVVTILGILIVLSVLFFNQKNSNLMSPLSLQLNNTSDVLPSPNSSPSKASFQFDGTTDLKMELEKVNPKVTDEDFQ